MPYLDADGITKLTRLYDARYIAEPSSEGTSGQVLTTDGAGGRTWQTVSGGGTTQCWYGTCSTAASTAAKVVACADFTLVKGAIISVLFSTANTAATPTLNVNSTGAKSIYIGSSTPNATTNPLKWSANTLLTFQYDGTYWRFLGAQSAGSVVPARGAATWYGTSSTAASTAAKAVTCANFVMTRGAVISVTFSTASTVSGAITLNVNSTGAKTVYVNNAATSASNTLTWTAGETLTFIFSGSYYYLVGRDATVNVEQVQTDGLAVARVGGTSIYVPTSAFRLVMLLWEGILTPGSTDELYDSVEYYSSVTICYYANDRYYSQEVFTNGLGQFSTTLTRQHCNAQSGNIYTSSCEVEFDGISLTVGPACAFVITSGNGVTGSTVANSNFEIVSIYGEIAEVM